jgi:hypothetical protein
MFCLSVLSRYLYCTIPAPVSWATFNKFSSPSVSHVPDKMIHMIWVMFWFFYWQQIPVTTIACRLFSLAINVLNVVLLVIWVAVSALTKCINFIFVQSSVLDPKLFFSDPDSIFLLNFGSRSGSYLTNKKVSDQASYLFLNNNSFKMPTILKVFLWHFKAVFRILIRI